MKLLVSEIPQLLPNVQLGQEFVAMIHRFSDPPDGAITDNESDGPGNSPSGPGSINTPPHTDAIIPAASLGCGSADAAHNVAAASPTVRVDSVSADADYDANLVVKHERVKMEEEGQDAEGRNASESGCDFVDVAVGLGVSMLASSAVSGAPDASASMCDQQVGADQAAQPHPTTTMTPDGESATVPAATQMTPKTPEGESATFPAETTPSLPAAADGVVNECSVSATTPPLPAAATTSPLPAPASQPASRVLPDSFTPLLTAGVIADRPLQAAADGVVDECLVSATTPPLPAAATTSLLPVPASQPASRVLPDSFTPPITAGAIADRHDADAQTTSSELQPTQIPTPGSDWLDALDLEMKQDGNNTPMASQELQRMRSMRSMRSSSRAASPSCSPHAATAADPSLTLPAAVDAGIPTAMSTSAAAQLPPSVTDLVSTASDGQVDAVTLFDAIVAANKAKRDAATRTPAGAARGQGRGQGQVASRGKATAKTQAKATASADDARVPADDGDDRSNDAARGRGRGRGRGRVVACGNAKAKAQAKAAASADVDCVT
jgi:hypothetical protein